MIILATQERKYETKTCDENFAEESSNLPFAVPGNVKLKLSIIEELKTSSENSTTGKSTNLWVGVFKKWAALN
jgi:hypothetical protein